MEVDGDDQESVIQELEGELAKVDSDLKTCRDRRKEIAHEGRTLKKTIRDLEATIPKLTVEVNGCDTTRKELTQLLPMLQAQTKLSDEDEHNLKSLQADLKRCENDMAKCTEAASGLEIEVEDLQKQIMNAGGSRLKEQQAACKKTVSELNTAEKSLNAARVAITSNEKAVKKAEGIMAKTESELATLEDQQEKFQQEILMLESDAVRVQKAFDKAKELEAKASKKMNEALTECEALKSTLSNAKFIELELSSKLEDLAKNLSQAAAKKDKWEADLAKLRDAAEEDLDDLVDSDSEDEDLDDHKPISTDDHTEPNCTTTNGSRMDVDEDVEATASIDEEQAVVEKTGPKPILPIYDPEELNVFNSEAIKHDIAVLEGERNTLAKNANMGAIAEYRKKEADYLSR